MIHERFDEVDLLNDHCITLHGLAVNTMAFDIDNVGNKVRKCAHTEDNRDREKNDCQTNAGVYTMHVSHS